MHTHSPLPAHTDPPETRRDKRARQLEELTDLGMAMARRVGARDAAQQAAQEAAQQAAQQAAPPETDIETEAGTGASPTPGPVQDFTIQFDRISRAVRRCMLLAERFEQPLAVRAEEDRAAHRAGARRQVIRTVEDTIQLEHSGGQAEALEAELHERLDSPELEDEIGSRPMAEIIDDLCRDLGMRPHARIFKGKRRHPADIADLHARAARPPAARPPGPTLGITDEAERIFRLVSQPGRG